MSTPESSTILQSGSGPSWSGSGPLPSGPATDAATFGRFQVLGEAGSGAMGVVYAAYDPKLDRRVALKVLRGEANRGEARERTRREAVALAQVNHPNVVHVYEVGEAAKRLFIAMEYVDGPTLKVWQAGDHDQRRRLEVLQAIAAGLDAAHARGLVHRDVKPSNVLIGPSGRPRLIDFGLARAGAGGELDDGSVLGSDLTRTGRLLGTPAYMAPELMDGAAPSALSDQFSFCVTAYEVLFGVRPFPTDSLPVLRHAIERGLMAAPTSSAAGHEALLAILRRGMAADPAARWPSLGALADALGAQRSVQPEGLAPPLYVAVMALVGFLWVSVIYALLPRRADALLLRDLATAGALALGVRLNLAKLRLNTQWRDMAPTVACGMAFQVLGAGVAWRFDVPLAAAYTLDSMWMAATFTAGHFVLRAPSAWPVAPGWLAVALSLALPDWAVELNFFFPLMAVALIGWTERPTRPAR